MIPLLPGTQFSVSTSGTWLSPVPVASTRTPGVKYLGKMFPAAESVFGIVLDARLDPEDTTDMIFVMLGAGVTGWMPQGFVDVDAP